MKIKRGLASILVLLTTFLLIGPYVNAREKINRNPLENNFDYKKFQMEFLRLLNEERQSKGLSSLSYNPALVEGTKIRASEIRKVFDHVRPNGERWNTLFKNHHYTLGENILAFISNPVSADNLEIEYAQLAFTKWKNSPGHYENMMRDFFKSMALEIDFAEDFKYKSGTVLDSITAVNIFSRQEVDEKI